MSSQPMLKADDIISQYSGSFSTSCKEKVNEKSQETNTGQIWNDPILKLIDRNMLYLYVHINKSNST